jgi:tRNA A-37 threonylcarbamoyl transferase component Bud32
MFKMKVSYLNELYEMVISAYRILVRESGGMEETVWEIRRRQKYSNE